MHAAFTYTIYLNLWALNLITLVITVILSITCILAWDAVTICTLEVYAALALISRLAIMELQVIQGNVILNRRKICMKTYTA